MAVIRTVQGDIDPADLGVTYLHEHLLTDPPANAGDPDLKLDNEDAAILELRYFHAAGGRALVEMTPRDYGRSAAGMRRVSETSGVHVIAVTGWLKEKFSKPWIESRGINDLADEMIREIEEGIDGTGVRAGVIKAGSSLNKITLDEEKVFRAAARAHLETGAPISTHTEAGTMALEQVALLRSEHVDPERILIGHLDRCMEWDYHLRLANTGVLFGYDQIAKDKYYSDTLRVEFIVKLVKAGFVKQVSISGDMARRSYFPSYGRWNGPGFTYILWRFAPWLIAEGLTAHDLDQVFIRTPAQFLQLEKS